MNLRQLLGIELPIIQAPMAGVQGSALAVAVSDAGGLGSLPCAMLSREAMRNELAAIKAQTTKPVNVNFFCHVPTAPNSEREALWRKIEKLIDDPVLRQAIGKSGRIRVKEKYDLARNVRRLAGIFGSLAGGSASVATGCPVSTCGVERRSWSARATGCSCPWVRRSR